MKIHNVVQGTIDWHLLRTGKPTASMFGKVIGEKAMLKAEIIEKVHSDEEHIRDIKKMNLLQLTELARLRYIDISPNLILPKTDYAFQLAAEILAGYDADEWLGNASTEHGHDAEMFARKAYLDITGVEPQQVGFITNDAETMGCSPDALVDDNGLLEIKAPTAKKVIQIYYEWLETQDCPPDYKMQIQGQLMITERSWCDLVLYHPRLDLKVIRVLPDLVLHEKLKTQIDVIIAKRDQIIDSVSEF